MFVCVCQAVTSDDIRQAVADGATTFEQLQARTACSTCCGCCEAEARTLFAAAKRGKATEPWTMPVAVT